MNWPLVRRGLLRYSLLAGGTTVGLVVYAFGPSAAVVTFSLGLAALLWAAGGGGEVRMGTVASNAESPGVGDASVRDHDEGRAASLPSDLALFFYGVGLVVCSPVAVAAVLAR
ncbi:hypothetical protein [Candidatus Halobonum tyrrellensis]|uniref:DUF8070 domain-containing protein n=1 Tax=Candidatus Halobonum tyrrellensis G22 TaxID=1324957 RepID=V4HC02_9EURY|nr:hypothetical protein [Candidatus Halobonum tyrrellensis]ESP87578.1 hypothetical protein K933_13379 [Candidatus Halobonum tyrrellensis G22]